MLLFTDQSGRNIALEKTPQRIISLVPSQTELLYDLGLDSEVIGITKFCVHPKKWFQTRTRVGGTRQLKMDVIHQLNPDLIIANKEENVKEQIDELSKLYPVWTSDVKNLHDAYDMIEQIGLLTQKAERSIEIIGSIQKEFSGLRTQVPAVKELRTCYLIWQKPFMTVGGDTFINAMMEVAGFHNIFKHHTRYPEIKIDDLHVNSQFQGCQLLLLSSEPFPFKQKDIDKLQPLLPGTKIILVDGEFFSWYGSRLLQAPEYFLKLRKQITDA